MTESDPRINEGVNWLPALFLTTGDLDLILQLRITENRKFKLVGLQSVEYG